MALMALAVLAGSTGFATEVIPSTHAPQSGWKHDPERVAKAQAKRERRAAKRIKGVQP